MKRTPVTLDDLRGVFAVPPLARRNDARRSLDFGENNLIVDHITAGGISRLIYGGNAFLYHIQLGEFEAMVKWLSRLSDELWVVPSIGPSYGRAMEQAAILSTFQFPCAMILPCSDPRDAGGMEQGYREISEVAEAKLIVYLKDESNLGSDKEAGLDAVARLVHDGVCIGIKYAVVSDDPQDPYLEALLERVDQRFVISGIGERPAVDHLRDWKLPGFTTGSGCIAPRLSQLLFEACKQGDFNAAFNLRARFLPLEDLRDGWGPAKVLHHATELAGIARTGPMPPYLSALPGEQLEELAPVARDLMRDKHQEAVSK